MAKLRSKGDVYWYSVKYKRPIAYSTTADSEAIMEINQPNRTAKELLAIFESGKYLVSEEMKDVMKAFIAKGLGDELIRTKEI